MSPLFQEPLKHLKRFFMGKPCISCKTRATEPYHNLCPSCAKNIILVKNQKDICPRCHDTWFKNGLCPNCQGRELHWDKLHTVFSYKDSLMKNLFYLYKFKNSLPAEKDLVLLLKEHLKEFQDYHFIIAPCGESTKKRLGFNPVTRIIAQLGFSYSEPLEKAKKSLNIKTLGGESRKQQLGNIICTQSISKEILEGKSLLVDDIFTTGSTLNQASLALKEQGFSYITCLCFLRS